MGRPQDPLLPTPSTSLALGDRTSTRARTRVTTNGGVFADVWEEERSDAGASLSPGACAGASPGAGAGIMPKKYQHYLVQSLSGGNKKKLSVAVANVGHPPLLAMDECTSG